MEARAALIAANELLRYRPVDDLYEEWLDRVAELVRAAGGSPAPSFSLHRAPSCAGNEAPGAPQPPPPQEGALAPRRVAPGWNPLRPLPARQDQSCQEVPRSKKLPECSLLRSITTTLLFQHAKTPRCSQL